uniref:Uncharacterized protein n=1 Tax=Strigamia maritima TaxID=126957 RepID=T1JMR4_STRMM
MRSEQKAQIVDRLNRIFSSIDERRVDTHFDLPRRTTCPAWMARMEKRELSTPSVYSVGTDELLRPTLVDWKLYTDRRPHPPISWVILNFNLERPEGGTSVVLCAVISDGYRNLEIC